jgi:hypothetical protein
LANEQEQGCSWSVPIRGAIGLVLSLRSERGAAGSVTHLDALLSQRLARLKTWLSPVRLDLLEML